MANYDDMIEMQNKRTELRSFALIKEMGYLPANTIHRNGIIYYVCQDGTVFIATYDKLLDIFNEFEWRSLTASIRESYKRRRKDDEGQISSGESDS
jgi:hypothetical protein